MLSSDLTSADRIAPGWMAQHIELWPIERLLPYVNNARTHSHAQGAAIAASIVDLETLGVFK